MLPPHEGPEPGYVLACFRAWLHVRERERDRTAMRYPTHQPIPEPPSHVGPFSSLSQAYAVTPPRHLAPTVGPAVALAGVFIRTGNFPDVRSEIISILL